MLLVPTYLEKSQIHGFGVFAAEFIPKGTKVWKFQAGFDTLIPEPCMRDLPEVVQKYLAHYGTPWNGVGIVFGDEAKFINHSYTPSLFDDLENEAVYAARDIQKGEELTENYREWDDGTNLKWLDELEANMEDGE